jgi:hypothetical protein
MPIEEQMTVSERRKYLKVMKARYVRAKREERGRMPERNERGDWVASQESDAPDAGNELRAQAPPDAACPSLWAGGGAKERHVGAKVTWGTSAWTA